MYPGHVKLDYDTAPLTYMEMRFRLKRAGYEILSVQRRVSPGGAGTHVELHLSPAPTSAVEVVALQAILGSDPFREACNLRRAKHADMGADPYWRERWNVLYLPHQRRRDRGGDHQRQGRDRDDPVQRPAGREG